MSEAAAAALFQLSPTTGNALLMIAEAIAYFAVLAGLFRARHRLGIGAFFCALGVMHFLETYLASVLYVPLPFGIVASPGSTVLFTGKLMMLLLVYIREDAVVVRQPIYGLLIGNVLLLALAALMRRHGAGAFAAAHQSDFGFLGQMGALMVWGTLILFADCVMMILLYERLRALRRNYLLLRLALTGALMLQLRSGRVLRRTALPHRRAAFGFVRRLGFQDGGGRDLCLPRRRLPALARTAAPPRQSHAGA